MLPLPVAECRVCPYDRAAQCPASSSMRSLLANFNTGWRAVNSPRARLPRNIWRGSRPSIVTGRRSAVIQTNPDALAIADALDKERKEKGPRGPMHGIPVLIKDNIDTADDMMTTAGSLALVGAKPPKDSFVAKRLRDAGAVILGKTNLSEWANIRSSHSTSGWSGRGGLTKNPYVLNRNPCGSSSGSGAGVSANLCAVAVGTETDGSIVCPSSLSGVVGIKPTVGLVSRSGHHSDFALARHGRADLPHGARCGDPVERSGGSRSGRQRYACRARQSCCRLHEIP